MFREYPYLNLQDLNLDYILRKIREMQTELNNFVVTNAIKYADPIDWNITTQYEKNTVVIDANSGIAYLSVQPVPSGVAITNTDYWTVIFDLSMFIDKNAKNLTDHVEGQTNTATFNSAVDDWLIWYDVLYKVIAPITAGDSYVVNSNIERITVEDIIKDILTDISTIFAAIGDVNNLDTFNNSNIVNAINAIDLYGAIYVNVSDFGAIGDGVTDDTQAFKDAIAFIGTRNKYILYIPHGTFKITDTLIFTTSGIIFGAGRNNTILMADNIDCLEFANVSGIELHSFSIQNSSLANSGHAINLYMGTNRVNIYDMFFYNNYVDIYCSTSITEVNINGITSFNWRRSSIFMGDTGYCGSLTVINSFFKIEHNYNTNGAIELKYIDVANIHGNTFITPQSNNILVEPENGQTASLLTFDGNCFDTSENGVYLGGNGAITRIVISNNTVQEMSNCGVIITNANSNYIIISNNNMFNAAYPINLSDSAIIDCIDISNNIIEGGTIGLRIAGSCTTLKANTNIFDGSSVSMTDGIVATVNASGVAFGNVFTNVTNEYAGTFTNLKVYGYYDKPYTTLSKTITTDANGCADLQLPRTSIIISIIGQQGDFTLIPYWSNTDTTYYVRATDATGAPIVSTTFTIDITYIP